jgi:hypothetical protein
MMEPKASIWGTTQRLLNIGFILKQIGLGALVFTISIVWLRVPDASVIEVVASILLALLIVSIAGLGESAILLQLCGTSRTPRRLFLGALILLAAVTLWFGWSSWIDHLSASNDQLAGYLNSRFPHGLRNFFSYSHIVLWLGWLETSATWTGACILALIAITITASARPAKAIVMALRSLSYWLVVIVGVTGARVFTTSILQWVPGQTLRVEMISLVLRLLAVIVVDATVACLVTLIVAACVRQSDAVYTTSEGTPDDSQERTVDIP